MNLKRVLMNILLIESNAFFRGHVVQALSQGLTQAQVQAFERGLPVLARCDLAPLPDLVLISLEQVDVNVFDFIEQLRRRCPQLPLLALAMNANDPALLRALQSGASGYVFKADSAAEICASVQHALDGQYWLCPQMARMILALPSPSGAHASDALNPREVVTLNMLSQSQGLDTLGELMNQAPSVVQGIIRQVYQKLRTHPHAALPKAVTAGGEV